jgi:hypothetical protein
MARPARAVSAPEADFPSDDPCRLGWRLRSVRLPDGRFELREEPLTEGDLLDPQLGDHVIQNSWHIATVYSLYDILSWRYEPRPDVFISSDLKMIWGILGIPDPAPDIAVIPGVATRAVSAAASMSAGRAPGRSGLGRAGAPESRPSRQGRDL